MARFRYLFYGINYMEQNHLLIVATLERALMAALFEAVSRGLVIEDSG